MINAGIFDGDLVIVEQQSTAENGDIVVAMIEDSAQSNILQEDGYYRLQPENDSMEPIIVNEVSIIGKVVGLYRSMK